jgi:hypothetical protein
MLALQRAKKKLNLKNKTKNQNSNNNADSLSSSARSIEKKFIFLNYLNSNFDLLFVKVSIEENKWELIFCDVILKCYALQAVQ